MEHLVGAVSRSSLPLGGLKTVVSSNNDTNNPQRNSAISSERTANSAIRLVRTLFSRDQEIREDTVELVNILERKSTEASLKEIQQLLTRSKSQHSGASEIKAMSGWHLERLVASEFQQKRSGKRAASEDAKEIHAVATDFKEDATELCSMIKEILAMEKVNEDKRAIVRSRIDQQRWQMQEELEAAERAIEAIRNASDDFILQSAKELPFLDVPVVSEPAPISKRLLDRAENSNAAPSQDLSDAPAL